MKFIPILLLIFTLISCNSNNEKKVQNRAFNALLKSMLSHSVDEITVAEASSAPNAIFLDARELEEFRVSRIKDAIWVGYDDFNSDRLSEVSKEDSLIVYCSIGARSEKIAEKLSEAGYTKVSNLYGGIFEWKNQGNVVYNNNGPTEKIHAYSKTWGVWLRNGEKVYGAN